MRKSIKTVHSMDAPADRVWEFIRQGDGVETWFSIIGTSQLQGTNRRVCTLQDGAPLEETILKSDALRIFMYSVDKQQSFPVERPVGTMRLEDQGDKSVLYWDLEFDEIDPEATDAFTAQVEGLYAAAAQQLEGLSKDTASV